MTKSKVLSVVLAGALVASMGAIAVSAADPATDSFGVVGVFTNWGNANEDGSTTPDYVMKDEDGDGILTAQVELEAGSYEWKVRTNSSWDDSWGEADEDGLTYNSQTNCKVEVAEKATYEFSIDTTGAEDSWVCSAVKVDTPTEPSADEPSADEPSTDAPSTDEPSTDAPATGDATAAYALVGVVVAALGVAVVMTKKASVK